MAALSKAPHPWKPVRSPSDRRPTRPDGRAFTARYAHSRKHIARPARPAESGTGRDATARDDARIAGWIYLTDVDRYARCAQIGYGVRPCARGRGFATEALTALARWSLTAGGLQRVWLSVNTDNLASLRVAQKAGFAREGTLRRASLEEDGLHDVAVLALLDDEI